MSLHRLTSITLAVPDISKSAEFMTDFGLVDSGGGSFATRDGGNQLELIEAPQRSLRRLGVGASSPDDLEQRRLPGAVRADDAHAVARLHLQRDAFEESAASDALREVLDAEQQRAFLSRYGAARPA